VIVRQAELGLGASTDLTTCLVHFPPEGAVHSAGHRLAAVAALAFVSHRDAVAPGVGLTTTVGDAVSAADRVVDEACDGAFGSAGVGARVADFAPVTALVRSTGSVSARALVSDFDTSTAGYTGVAVGLSVGATHRVVVGGADTDVAAFAFVGDFDAGAASFTGLAVGSSVDATYRGVLISRALTGVVRDACAWAPTMCVTLSAGRTQAALVEFTALAIITLLVSPTSRRGRVAFADFATFFVYGKAVLTEHLTQDRVAGATALALVVNLSAVTPGVLLAATVGYAVRTADRVVAKAGD